MPSPQPLPERVGNLILHALKAHEGTLGVETLSLVLKGSKDKRVMQRKLHESPLYGCLFYYGQDTISHFIFQLLEQGYLHKVVRQDFPYPAPFLYLTEKGTMALVNNEDPHVEKRITPLPTSLNASEQETLNTFQQFRDVALVAKLRGLAESTIYGHLESAVRLRKILVEEIVNPEKLKRTLNNSLFSAI